MARGFDKDDCAIFLGPRSGCAGELSPRLYCSSAKKAREFLASRANAYKAANHKLTARAISELSEYRRGQGEAVIDEMMDAAAQDGKATAMLEKQ